MSYLTSFLGETIYVLDSVEEFYQNWYLRLNRALHYSSICMKKEKVNLPHYFDDLISLKVTTFSMLQKKHTKGKKMTAK